MKLELRNVQKNFACQPVLDDLTYRCEAHSLVILGPSGCGKSTLLRLLAGLIPADYGEMSVNGEALGSEETALRSYRKQLGIVFQSSNLFPHLNARDNLLLPLEKVHGLATDEARRRVDALLEKFQLSAHAHKTPAQLSGGQRQRVAIARALAHEPKLLLLDEPTSALDPEMAAEVLNTVETLKQNGTDFVLVTHQIPFARRVADEVLFLSGGRIHESGTSQAIFKNPKSALLKDFLRNHLEY